MIIDNEKWQMYQDKNTDGYGGACILVAREVFKILDANDDPLNIGYFPDMSTAHGIICKADEDSEAGGITGFMANCVNQMVFWTHSRGAEFYLAYSINTYDMSESRLTEIVTRIVKEELNKKPDYRTPADVLIVMGQRMIDTYKSKQMEKTDEGINNSQETPVAAEETDSSVPATPSN